VTERPKRATTRRVISTEPQGIARRATVSMRQAKVPWLPRGALRLRTTALRAALASDDREQLSRLAHSLIGSSVSFGANALAEHCRALRQAADDDTPGDLSARISEIAVDFTSAHAVLVNAISAGVVVEVDSFVQP
jgi:chemotaxis protein histidine kinase CheA